MNCDTAFELMTDAHGSQSGILAGHLADCPRCRQMQAALAPALDFLNEAAPPFTEAACDPHHWRIDPEPRAHADTTRMARETATRLTGRPRLTDQNRTRRLATAGSILVAACAGFWLALGLLPSRSDQAAPLPTACTRQEAARDDKSRTPADIQALAQSCARCHGALPADPPVETSLFPENRTIRSHGRHPVLDDFPQPALVPRSEAGPVEIADRHPALDCRMT